ncbi:MAG: hypothetical protein CMH56_13325 [Myxococcales bacterium]|nr:hypothetical protein [Myxococcales bacterium]
MKRLLQVLFVLLLIGFGGLWGQKMHHQEAIDACSPCYNECKRTFAEIGAEVTGGFHWASCRDFCHGRDLCKDKFVFQYVGAVNSMIELFDSEDVLTQPKPPPKNQVKTGDAFDAGNKAVLPSSPAKSSQQTTPSPPPQRKGKAEVKKNWEDAKSHCASQGMRLPDKNEMSQHLLSLPRESRTGQKFWASGPLYPDGFPPLVSMSVASFSVTPGDPSNAHGVFCFPK